MLPLMHGLHLWSLGILRIVSNLYLLIDLVVNIQLESIIGNLRHFKYEVDGIAVDYLF